MQESDALDRWFVGLDDFTRRRVLRLRPADLLPADVALDLQRHGIHVTRLHSAATGEDVWAQPEELMELIAGHDP